MPELSLVVPMYNAEPYLEEALRSLLAQSFRDFELILADDASIDGTVALAKSFSDPRIRVLEGKTNHGPAHARNRALDAAKGEFIGFFDADDIALPELFAEELSFLKQHSEIQLVGAWNERMDAHGRSLGRSKGYDGPPGKIPATLLFGNWLGTSSLLLRREALGNRRFDETMPVASDYELWVRVLEQNQAAVLPRPLVRYRVYERNLSHRKAAQAQSCTREIAVRQLRRLGIEPTSIELDIHHYFNNATIGTSREVVRAGEEWLLKLKKGNLERRVYDGPLFLQVLGEQWFRLCHSACGHGWWTWKTFHASPLAAPGRISAGGKRSFLSLVLRGAAKRRFPALATVFRRKTGPA